MAQMSINTEAVNAAVNQISVMVADIQTRTTKFVGIVQEKNEITNRKWTLLKKLEEQLQKEVKNVNDIIEAETEVKATLDRYSLEAEEVDDASELM